MEQEELKCFEELKAEYSNLETSEERKSILIELMQECKISNSIMALFIMCLFNPNHQIQHNHELSILY